MQCLPIKLIIWIWNTCCRRIKGNLEMDHLIIELGRSTWFFCCFSYHPLSSLSATGPSRKTVSCWMENCYAQWDRYPKHLSLPGSAQSRISSLHILCDAWEIMVMHRLLNAWCNIRLKWHNESWFWLINSIKWHIPSSSTLRDAWGFINQWLVGLTFSDETIIRHFSVPTLI